ncbi:MAG TPA: M14 family zinc carboxypeptidase [Holophagaceae bacterium]|nr:M14 family zinc carboxypeptidase [Holophagaceae bacterium]
MRGAWLGLLAAALAAGGPSTVPERTAFHRTSTVAEVRAFMDGMGLHRYRPEGAPAVTETGAPLLAWRLPATGPHPLRVYLNANIHAGEVEGKEAVQELARELVEGEHPGLRKRLEFVFMPCYNAEGTDALDPAIRRHQPNPESGVGRRETTRGLDLNRDAMKAQAPNTRWFLAMLRDFDPDAVFDLHTTNGSYHGFHLTYAPALHPATPAPVLEANRRMLREVRERLDQEGLPTYDYGNFEPEARTGAGWSAAGGPDPQRWETYDWLPRYLTNYAGLTGRLAVLSEAYVYRSFPERIADTRQFVLACLDWMAAHPSEVATARRGARLLPEALPLSAEMVATERHGFDLVDPIKNDEGRVLGEKSRRHLELPAHTAFQGLGAVALPQGYLVDAAYAFRVKPLLEAHGIKVLPGSARPKGVVTGHFVETGRTLAKAPFQGVFALDLQGRWSAEEPHRPMQQRWAEADLDRALYVPLVPATARAAFYLLDPRSPDGLVHWGFFAETLLRNDGSWGEPPRFPILAVGPPPESPVAAPPANGAFSRAE